MAAAAAAVSSPRPSPLPQPTTTNATFVTFPRRPLPAAAATLALSAPSPPCARGSALVPAANPKYHNAKVDAGDEDVDGEELLRRFTWQVSRAGVMEEIRRRRRHEDARDRRKRKARSAARKFRRSSTGEGLSKCPWPSNGNVVPPETTQRKHATGSLPLWTHTGPPSFLLLFFYLF
ncbi:uncharacterized protein LOC120711248 isoform X1 [Panicum virgatum]|uniref:uncharacterized protein LOC120711248 isoform X1 n=1 Tax=Panicum virgatum TaxID=38727 RepID=UPI0019D6186E|nr:uncharacterized protein LOC120711248 isoform X1 [Panicum virgatum]